MTTIVYLVSHYIDRIYFITIYLKGYYYIIVCCVGNNVNRANFNLEIV